MGKEGNKDQYKKEEPKKEAWPKFEDLMGLNRPHTSMSADEWLEKQTQKRWGNHSSQKVSFGSNAFGHTQGRERHFSKRTPQSFPDNPNSLDK